MFEVIRDNIVLLGLYFVPSLLYCFYNNLAFANLTLFDPTTYYLLLQFRVVITALLFQVNHLLSFKNLLPHITHNLYFQIIFKKYLTGRQWIALIMLTIGCMVKHIDAGSKSSEGEDSIFKQMFSVSALLILVQSFCSSLAGVYNEYLLKHKGVSVDIYIQNALMYVDSIVCNIFIIIFEGKSSETFNLDALQNIFHFNIIIIMLNNAAIGVITSFFLKTLNSILKTFASALELVFTAIACYLLFGIPINTYTVFSILIVSISVVIYSQNPVDNRPKSTKTQDEVSLLDEESEV